MQLWKEVVASEPCLQDVRACRRLGGHWATLGSHRSQTGLLSQCCCTLHSAYSANGTARSVNTAIINWTLAEMILPCLDQLHFERL